MEIEFLERGGLTFAPTKASTPHRRPMQNTGFGTVLFELERGYINECGYKWLGATYHCLPLLFSSVEMSLSVLSWHQGSGSNRCLGDQ